MKLKQGLLFMILDNPNDSKKYSRSFLNLKNVFDLESKEKFSFSKEILKKFADIEKEYHSFMSGIPLSIVEAYYNENLSDLKKFIFIEYTGKEITDVQVIDIFYKLEGFFAKVFALACEIANYYNIEIKIKGDKGSKVEMI